MSELNKTVRFNQAWSNAKQMMRFKDLALSVLLATMAEQAEAFAEIAADTGETVGIDAVGLFDVSVDFIEDFYSRENLKQYLEEYAIELSQFKVEQTRSYRVKLPE